MNFYVHILELFHAYMRAYLRDYYGMKVRFILISYSLYIISNISGGKGVETVNPLRTRTYTVEFLCLIHFVLND
jgi:hypothetical protein